MNKGAVIMLLLVLIIVLFLSKLFKPEAVIISTNVLQSRKEFYMNEIEQFRLCNIENEIKEAYEKRQRERLEKLLIRYSEYDDSGDFLEENAHLRKFIFYEAV